jgi:two-component system chemotaxis response regulator CheB
MGDDNKIRVLIADDSAFMRKVLRDLLERDPQIEIAGEARDGRDAVRMSEELRPDVICMDLLMPHMDGLQATEIIMSTKPRPILVVSSETKDGAEPTVRALELGAIDFVGKPSAGIDLDMASVSGELVRKVKLAAKVHVVRTAARKAAMPGEPVADPPSPPIASQPLPPRTLSHMKMPLVVIAASTGGPQTLMQIMPQFPESFVGAVLIVQHMPGDFTSVFSKQLAEVSAMRVKEAERGEMMREGTAYICPGTHHMRVSITGRLLLED